MNVALADLVVTGLVIPVSVIVILAGHEESLATCRFEWTLEALCFLVTVLTLAAIAFENYARLCLPAERYVWEWREIRVKRVFPQFNASTAMWHHGRVSFSCLFYPGDPFVALWYSNVVYIRQNREVVWDNNLTAVKFFLSFYTFDSLFLFIFSPCQSILFVENFLSNL